MVLIGFFLSLIFMLVGTTFVFFAIERLLDGSTIPLKEKLKILYKNPKNLDTEKKKLSFHYRHYLIGSVFLAVLAYSFIHPKLFSGSLSNMNSLIILIILFLFGVSEVVNEYLYEESKIDYQYYEKYGWKYAWKVAYHKDIMKNSPITLIRDGVLLLIVGFFVLILILGLILILL